MEISSSQLPIWKPDAERVDNSNMTAFVQFLKKEKNLVFNDYKDLYEWSVDSISDFWESVWEYADFIHSKTYDSVLVGKDIRTARWFDGARLNFAENLLRHKDQKEAIVYWSETGERKRLTFKELHGEVAAVAQYLRSVGIKKNDRVAAFISNRPEAIIGMLAAASIGAMWSSCSPDFGFEGVLDRFGQIEPKVLIAIKSYQYHGKEIDCTKKVNKIVESIASIEKLIWVNTLIEEERSKHSFAWEEVRNTPTEKLIFEQLPFDHPLYIMYSSGTTGKPKCIVHGAGGTLIQHFKELSLHSDLKVGDVITYYTTCGWMMWNWLASSLMIGATIFVYDGSPMFPHRDILFQAIEKEKINIFGTSPKFLFTCESKGLKPVESFDLSSLSTVLSTGSPLSDKNFDYVYREIKPDVQLASISGGTDIISCFMLGNPNLPVYKGELQCRGLGMKVETFDENGRSVTNEIGELVCTAPFPSRPLYFWGEENGEKYRKAYFEEFENVWRHGDFVKINERGGCIVYGRSDATLNSGGIRIGTAEIYGPVEALEEIEDSIVVGIEKGSDTVVVLFVVLKGGAFFSDELKNKINSTLRTSRSPRHVPAKIFQVSDIPRTMSGKKVELAVKKILEGKPIDNKEALINPETLLQFSNFKSNFI